MVVLMKRLGTITRVLVLAAGCLGALSLQSTPGFQTGKPRPLAVLVNQKNPTTNLTFRQLRSYFKLEQQFWPSKESCVLYLRPTNSDETQVLLKDVYKMTSPELRKYWVSKVFRGEISSKPTVIPTAKAAGSRVKRVVGAITVVLADEVPDGVRVLTIDGKKPDEAGYPLVVPAADSSASAGR
jgi:hypothetical protein